jgi:hypothetical protein
MKESKVESELLMTSYSYLSAVTGSNLLAVQAGAKPETMPVTALMNIPTTTRFMEKLIGVFLEDNVTLLKKIDSALAGRETAPWFAAGRNRLLGTAQRNFAIGSWRQDRDE